MTTVPLVYVNGKRYDLPPDKAGCTLLHFLRGKSFVILFRRVACSLILRRTMP